MYFKSNKQYNFVKIIKKNNYKNYILHMFTLILFNFLIYIIISI